MSDYPTRIETAIREKRTPALVGLDPRFDLLPQPIVEEAKQEQPGDRFAMRAFAYERFCSDIIEAVAPLVPAVKPQVAFFEALGPPGLDALRRVMRTSRKHGLLVIADAKRGDIGSTAEAYAEAWLAGNDPDAAPFPADALTINPSLGNDTLRPFLDRAAETGAGLYALVRTSNPGSKFPQAWEQNGEPLYRETARQFQSLSVSLRNDHPRYGPLGAVVGATHPEELAELRRVMPSCPLLVPGYGSQGGTAADVAAAFDSEGGGALVNSSRGIIFAHARESYRSQFTPDRWQDAVQQATRDMIADLAEKTPAGLLCRDQS